MANGTPIGALAVKVGGDIGDLLDAFNAADKATEKFSRQVEKRLTEPLARFSAAAAAAGAAVFAFTKGAADLADEAGKTAQKVGMTVEAFSGMSYAARLANVSNDQLGQGLKQLSKFMVENNITGVGVEEQLLRIADSFSKAADDENKTAAAMKYFGKSGADLIPLLNQGRAGIEELRKEAERLGVVFSAEAARKAEEFNDNLTRLKASAQGLQVELAGPLVEALNKSAKAMLDAKIAGEGFFATMLQGFRTLVTGDDAHKAAVEMAEAGEQLAKAWKDLDEARRRAATSAGGAHDPMFGGEDPAQMVAMYESAVRAAEARIKALRERNKILAPEEQAKEEQKKTGSVTVPDDGKAAKEAAAREQEVRDVMHAVRKADDERELAQIARQNEEKARLTEQGIREDLLFQEFQRDERDRIRREEIFAQREQAAQEKALLAQRLAATQSFLSNGASLMNTSSRRTFQVGKAFALAEAGVRTTLATIEAFEWGTKVGGYWTGIAMAALAAAAGLNMMNNIRQQQFGGGGGPPTPAGQGSSGIAAPTTAAASGGQSSDGGQLTILELNGDVFSADGIRKLVARLNEGRRAGDRIIVR